MHWTRVSLFCLGAALLASSQPAVAQVVDQQTGVVRLDDYSGSMALSNDGGSWMQVDRMSGNGVGFQSGYTRVGVRSKWLDFGESHVFTELNGTINDQSRLGTNLNVGYRTMYDGGVLGIFGAYDNYESNYGHQYQQGVVGAEYLHQWLDLRANGYMPFGDRDNFIGVLNPGTALTFFGHDFGTIGKGQIERSLAGFDLEGGVPLPIATFLRIYGGTYMLTAAGDDTWGVRSRLEARVGQGATMNFMVSDDDRFGTNLNFNATIWYGGGRTSPFRFMRDRSGWARRYDPIRRAQTVQLAEDHIAVNVPLHNAETGNRFDITWVDNTAAAGGNGTFEHPFKTLPDSAPGSDYILVRHGVGNTTGNITLEDNQHLFGEGRVYTVSTIERGIVTIPDAFFNQSGPRPTLAPGPGNANIPLVTLANNNQVINFNMTGGTAPAVEALTPINKFDLEHLNITSAIGVNLVDASGLGILNDIQVPNVAANQTGIFVRNSGGDTLDLVSTNISTNGGDFGMQVIADGATVNALLQDVTTDRTADTAIVLDQFNGQLNATLNNVDVRNTGNATNDGILVSSVLGATNVTMNNVKVRGVGDLLTVSGIQTGIQLHATNLDVSNSVTGSGVTIDVDNTIGTFGFTNLTSSNNAGDGFRLNATNGSVVSATVTNSDVSFNGDNNFDVSASGGSVVTLVVDPTSATDSGNEAVQFSAVDPNTVLNMTFTDVDLARAGSSAISGVVDQSGLAKLFLTNVQASDSGLHGLTVNVTNSADFLAVIQNSTFTRSGIGNNGIGVNLIASNNANVLISMTDTPANNNGSEGLHYEALTGVDGASSIIGLVTRGNFSDNPTNNVFGFVNGPGSFANWTFTDTTADLLGANGAVNLSSIGGGRQDIVWNGPTSSISQSTSDGVVLSADGANSVLNFSFSDGQINTNAGQGIDALATNGGQIRVDLTNAQATLNTNENVLARALTGGQAFVNATNTNLSSGGLTTNLDNVLLTANGAGSIVGGVFDGAVMDNSGLNGLHAIITNQGSLDLQLSSVATGIATSASNNLNGSGVRIEASNANTITVASNVDPLNPVFPIFSGNKNDNVSIDVAGANSAIIQLAGAMNNSATGDGIRINLDSVAAGGIDIGPGTANNNFDDGVDIFVSNSTLDQGISVRNMTVTGNGDEPIVVVTTGSNITGGSITGNTVDGGNNGISWSSDSSTVDVNITNNTITNAADNGILVTLNGTAIGNDVHIDFNSVTGDGTAPLNGIQLRLADNAELVNGTINGNSSSLAANYGILVNATDNAKVDALTVDSNVISQSGIDGFLYTASGNTTLSSLVISDNASSQNVAAGISVLLDSVLGNGDVQFRGNLATGNGADGIVMTGVNTSLNSLQFLANDSETNGGNGILVDMTSAGADTLTSVFGQGNIASSNAANGVRVRVDGFNPGTNTDVIWQTTTASNNGARGLSLELSNMNFGNVVASGSVFSQNGTDGVAIELTNANATNVVIDTNSSAGNAGAGALVATTGSTVNLLQVSNNDAASGSGLSNNGGSGLALNLDSSTINSFLIDGNLIDANGAHGVDMNVTGGTVLPLIANSLVTGNTITNQAAGDGFHLVNPDTGGTNFGINFDGNIITGNTGGSGVNLTLDGNSGVVTTSFTSNTLSNNGNSGLLANLTQTADLQVVNFQDNAVDGNTQMGVRIITKDTSNLLFDGSLGGNSFNGNVNAGLGALVAGNSTADIRLSNSTITNTTAGAIADFAGQGIHVVVQDTATLAGTSEFNGNTITGNRTAGVDLLVRDFGVIGGLTINDNTIDNNGANGVRIERQESGKIGLVGDRLEISGNTITNAQEGVFIIAANTDSTDFYQMNDNILNNLTFTGVHFEVRADADIDVNMDNNQLSNAGNDGILVTEQINSASDSRSVTGVWTNNTITNNGRDGINLSGATNGLIIGDVLAPGFPPPLQNGNTITGNGRDGIEITGPGSVAIVGNLIDNNGSGGASDAGIRFHGATFNDVVIFNNAITNNKGDGIQYEGDGVFGSVADIEGNNISFNTGRGLNLLVQPSGNGVSDVDMTFNNNIVSNNLLEGVYVVFTASRTQSISASSTAALAADGNFTDSPHLRFNADGNQVTANGINSNFSSTGIVVRVGTTQASQSTTDNGGFASDGLGNFTRSGVIMSITNSVMGGNFGDDVYFESFASTQTPPTSAGTWGTTDDPTAITTYRADPLARLDLTFTGNTFDSTATTNVGAFYNNAEGTFKSRLNNANAPNQGPFPPGTDDRRRNAQRQASRYVTNVELPPNATPGPDSYLYPGMGNSTFRVSAGSQLGQFTLDDPTLVGSPTEVDAIFEANGVLRGGSVFGELPYGWGTF